MAIITASKIAKSFGAEDIFGDVNASIPHGARIALVGPNGAGKTTLIRILIGMDMPSAGIVHRSRSLTIGYLPQEAEHAFEDELQTVWQEMMTVFADLFSQESALREMERQMSVAREHDPSNNSYDQQSNLMQQYGAALERFEHSGGYDYQLRTQQVLGGLGFNDNDFNMPIAHLSGGQKTRALLAKLLLQSPDFLILDEPTNHLDIQAIEWLETQLVSWPGSILVVSHDRYFLDKVVNRIWELDRGGLETYRGNYSAYITQREERFNRQLDEFKAQQAYISKEEDFIRRHMAGQRTKEAQGRLKRLNRLKRDNPISQPRRNERLGIQFNSARRSGDIILQTQDLVVGYSAGSPLFKTDDIDFRRTECAALIGPNGAGKTTFLRTILEEIPPLSGKLRRGASLEIGYFSQAHAELDIETGRTVLEEFLSHYPMLTSEARDFLARFLFTQDDVYKKTSALSGGERGRLALSFLMQKKGNFLVLDEPTNHLDIPAQEVLESVLNEFDGTIILVSHDRYLVSRLATQIWHLENRRLEVFKGSYQEFVAMRDMQNARLAEQSNRKPRERRTPDPQLIQARRQARRISDL
ncbi:MAG: ABC-F family ATP-binding cassette domain-containing protein, partial [Anaerolineales bacterium]|nr:ABC-F family ATP-binding cassette domain-containing protein [Anaerolineales bacterium]